MSKRTATLDPPCFDYCHSVNSVAVYFTEAVKTRQCVTQVVFSLPVKSVKHY